MLGSGMLSQSRVLTGIGNNLANINTNGYRREVVTTSAFGSMVMARIDDPRQELGEVTLIQSTDEMQPVFSQGSVKETSRALDFAIDGDGFFGVQTANGVQYTRNGNFIVDGEGYLALGDMGRVLGQNGPIHLGTDMVESDGSGTLYVDGAPAGRIALYDFADYGALKQEDNGMFTGAGGVAGAGAGTVRSHALEGSNVDAGTEMTSAVAAQRQLQSCSQAFQIYNQMLSRATTEIAKV